MYIHTFFKDCVCIKFGIFYLKCVKYLFVQYIYGMNDQSLTFRMAHKTLFEPRYEKTGFLNMR